VCVVFSRKRGQKTHTESCPQWRPDSATSAKLTRSRHPTGTATGTACLPWRNVAASRLDPPAALVQTPNAFQVVFTEGHFRGVPQGSAEMSPLFRSGNPLRWIPGPFQQSPLRRRDPNPPPPSPQRTSAAIPTSGSVGRRPLCQSRETLFLSLRGTPEGMLPHVAPSRAKCSAVVYADCAALERLPDST